MNTMVAFVKSLQTQLEAEPLAKERRLLLTLAIGFTVTLLISASFTRTTRTPDFFLSASSMDALIEQVMEYPDITDESELNRARVLERPDQLAIAICWIYSVQSRERIRLDLW